MSEPVSKRQKLTGNETESPRWIDLEAGIWEATFCKLDCLGDKQNVRLVCRSFKACASRTIQHLELKNSQTDQKSGISFLANRDLPGSFLTVKSIKCYANMMLTPSSGCQLHLFSQLRMLHFDGWGQQLDDCNLKAICSLQNLRTLILFDCHLEETSGRASLSRLQNLQTLELVRCQPQDTRSLMASIGQLSGLKHLKIAKPFTFCDRGYSGLSGLTNLLSLRLGHSWMLGAGPENLHFVSCLTKLVKISITKCFVNDEDLQPLQRLENLQLLGICESNRISGALFQHLTGLSKLHGLTLEGSNQLTDAGVANIAQLTSLQQLHLGSSSSITLDACKKHLPELISLTRLRLPRDILARWPAAEVCKAFPRLRSYIAAPQMAKAAGVIEENLLRWAISDPELLETGRCQILDWFHESRC